MVLIREPAVAGSFYPSDPDELRTAVQTLLDGAEIYPGPAPRALIVPHAGYIYSGPVAASAYAQLLPHRSSYRRVVLLGPAHHVPVSGLALPGVELFKTPLGMVPVCAAAFRQLGRSAVTVNRDAHLLEHSLEVQLPFLQLALESFRLVPLLVGVSDTGTVARAIERLWRREGTLVVVSTDLSHYLPYAEAGRRDGSTCNAVMALSPKGIGHTDACGCEAMKGLLTAARNCGMQVMTLDLRNSGDTAGMRDRVVGYGSWMFRERESCRNAA